MHIRRIERTELNGMILQHTQTLPEIVYKGCAICFIDFDGDIEGVGTRITDLNHEEFLTLKELIGMIEFENDVSDYTAIIKNAMEIIKKTTEEMIDAFENGHMIWRDDINKIRKCLIEIDLFNARLNDW